MTEPAVGIHDHPELKLGKRPPKLGASVAIGEFLRAAGARPPYPGDDPVPALVYPMDKNNVAGDCVVAGLDHALQTIHAALGVPRTSWTDDQILAFYQTQNPGFTDWSKAGTAADGGMDIQTFLEYLVAQKEIVAFGRIDHTDEELLKAATYVGLAVVTGELLTVSQQTQQVWDYVPGDPQWGGHCTCTVAYSASPDQQADVSWGTVYEATQAFTANQVEEAWFVLTQAHIDHPAFRDNFDLPGFADAIAELTNGKVIVPVPKPKPPTPPTPPEPPEPPTPPTPPEPPQPPAPDPLADFPFHLLDEWSKRPFGWTLTFDASAAYRAWRQKHPSIKE